MNNIQKKTYIDKDETDSMEKTNKWKKNKLCAHTILNKITESPNNHAVNNCGYIVGDTRSVGLTSFFLIVLSF